MPYLKLYQNNSGGYMVVDELQADYVVIECNSVNDEHVDIIYDSLDFSMCECCGDRWSLWAKDDEDLEDTISLYSKDNWWEVHMGREKEYKNVHFPIEESHEKLDNDYDPSTEEHTAVIYRNLGKVKEYWKPKKNEDR